MGDGAAPPPAVWGDATIGLKQLRNLPDEPPGHGGQDPYEMPPVQDWVEMLRGHARGAVPNWAGLDQLRGPAYNAPRFGERRPQWMNLETDEMLVCWKDIVADPKYQMDDRALVFFGNMISDHDVLPHPNAGKMEGYRIIAHLIKDRYCARESSNWTNWLYTSADEANRALENPIRWNNGTARYAGKGPNGMMYDDGKGKDSKGTGKNDKGKGKKGIDYGFPGGKGHNYGYADWEYKGHGKKGGKGFGKDKDDDGPWQGIR